MWAIVLLLVNVIWNTVDARYINILHKGKRETFKEDQEFANLEKRQQITGELEIDGRKFESLGCWRDAWSRSLPTLEGEHYLLMDPNYKGRRHALFKCARAALDKGYKLFGIENGGQCFASAEHDKRYHKYGVSKECKGDGKGGPWSLQVYRFFDTRNTINGAYGQWSSWGTCSRTCAGGVRRRMRKCSNPSSSNGGRDCRSLGPSVESQDCNVKSCTDKSAVSNPGSPYASTLSTKRDENLLGPSVGASHSGSPAQTNLGINNAKNQEDHPNNEDMGLRVGRKQQSLNNNADQSGGEDGKYVPVSPALNNNGLSVGQNQQPSFDTNGDKSNKKEGKYGPVTHAANDPDLGLSVKPKQQLLVSNGEQPNEEEEKYRPTSHATSNQDTGLPVAQKQQSPNINGDHSSKEGGKYIPMSREDVKTFKQIASFQNSKFAPNPGQGSDNTKGKESDESPGIPSQGMIHDTNRKQPTSFTASPASLNSGKEQENGISPGKPGNYVSHNNALTQQMPSPNGAPAGNSKNVWVVISKPSVKGSKQPEAQNGMFPSSSDRPTPNIPHDLDNQVESSAGDSQSLYAKQPSINGDSIGGGSERNAKNVGALAQDLSQTNGRIGAGAMASIPTDKTHNVNSNKMAMAGNTPNQKGISTVGESLRVGNPRLPEQIPTDADYQEHRLPQQYSSDSVHNQGIEIRITPTGNNIPKQQQDVAPAQSKQNFQNMAHNSFRVSAKGEESSSSGLQNPQNNTAKQESLYAQQNWKPDPEMQSTGEKYQEANSESGQVSQYVKAQRAASHEKSFNFSPNAVKPFKGLPQQRPSGSERQDAGQKSGKEFTTSNQLSNSISQHGKTTDTPNHFSSKGAALLQNNGQNSQQVQTNPHKEDNGGSKLKEKDPQQVSDSSKGTQSGEDASSHQTPEGDKIGNQNSDKGQTSQEEGEPVPVVDLNKAGAANGADYGPTSNEMFPGPPEDAGMQNQPEPNSNDVSQPSGPVYDNEAIQGISEMSQREDQNILQQANPTNQAGPDEGMGIGYDETDMSQAYTGENQSEKVKEEMEDETTTEGRYQPQVALTDYYNTEPAGDCLCPKKECSAKADIAFLVDGSGNIPQPYYARVLEFIKIFSRGFDKSNVHMGMMSYGDNVKTALDLKALDDFNQFDDAVNIAPYMGGQAHTGNALSKMKTGLFAISGRQDAPRALILLSSGGSVDDVVAPGEELRDSGVKVTAIGLGKQANVRELITVASEPKSEHVFTAFLDTLPNAMDEIIQGVCRDVMGIVQDRQEPCTCETYNGQVGPSHDYNKEASEKEVESADHESQQGQDLSHSQDQSRETEGTIITIEQKENQLPDSYQQGNNNESSQQSTVASNRPVGNGRLAYDQRGDQANTASEKPTDEFNLSEIDYANEQQSTNQGDSFRKLNKQGSNHGQMVGDQEERPLGTTQQPSRLGDDHYKAMDEKENQEDEGQAVAGEAARLLSTQQQQSRLGSYQYKAVDETKNRQDEEDSIGTDDYSANHKFNKGGQDERLKNNSFDGAKGHINSRETYRFAAGFPEHYKPRVNDGDEKPLNQETYSQQENSQSSEAHNSYQGTDDHQGDSFPSSSTLNHERVQGSGLHSHPAFIPPTADVIHGRPFTQPRYPQGSSKGQDELSSEYRRPSRVMAVGKASEYVNTGGQEQECTGVNLGVVLDSAVSPVGQGKQQASMMMDLAKKVSHLFPVSSGGNSVGMVVYGGSPQPSVVHFDKFLDQKSMDEAIDNANNPNLEIRIGKALTLAQKHLFSQLSLTKRNVLLLVTDGASFDDVSRPALELKRRGIEVFCLGVGKDVNRAQLDLIASEPKKSHVFWAPFNDSDMLMGRIKKEICLAANRSIRMQTQRKCPSDLGFVIDGSRSVEVLGKGNYKKMLQFVKNVSLGFHISPEDTRVGAITYGTEPKLVIPFNKYTSPNGLRLAIENISYPGTVKMTGKALDFANQKLFDKGSRINVPKVLVVLTDGTSRDSVENSAQALHKAGVTVISVGLGPVYNNAELDNIASMPATYHVIKAKFNELQDKVNELQDKICKVKKAQNKLI